MNVVAVLQKTLSDFQANQEKKQVVLFFFIASNTSAIELQPFVEVCKKIDTELSQEMARIGIICPEPGKGSDETTRLLGGVNDDSEQRFGVKDDSIV
jgi:hypothetical protein